MELIYTFTRDESKHRGYNFVGYGLEHGFNSFPPERPVTADMVKNAETRKESAIFVYDGEWMRANPHLWAVYSNSQSEEFMEFVQDLTIGNVDMVSGLRKGRDRLVARGFVSTLAFKRVLLRRSDFDPAEVQMLRRLTNREIEILSP